MNLQSLDLYKNDIGDEGASAIAEALKMNTSLKTLYLGDNGIGEKGADALAKALKMNKSLQNLYLEGIQQYLRGRNQRTSRSAENEYEPTKSESKMCAGMNRIIFFIHLFSVLADHFICSSVANGIGKKGAGALTGALRMNTRVKIVI
ncbi:hypothetical protein BC936DRAFT_149115 [Jimgerdemannia flammicorona]|uniref:Uncharacterized protein n=1 Tax=Jimgerdemannia flammicorona TaxID=994334 RepID=A0A433DK83_9FUNG|nr:hypothetical protein BC936DRAFT_149115 [Jimgerdemannia flammicorona]